MRAREFSPQVPGEPLPGADAGQWTMVSDLQRHGTAREGIYYTLQTVARQSADTPAPQSPRLTVWSRGEILTFLRPRLEC